MKKEQHVTKLRIRQPDGESVDLSSSNNFMWSEPQSVQLTIHIGNLMATYGREALKDFITECIYPELKQTTKKRKVA